jgi:hypothetical protein
MPRSPKARFCATIAQRLVQIREELPTHGLLARPERTHRSEYLCSLRAQLAVISRSVLDSGTPNDCRCLVASGSATQTALRPWLSTDYPSTIDSDRAIHAYSGVVSFPKYQNGGNDSIWPFRGPKRRQCTAAKPHCYRVIASRSCCYRGRRTSGEATPMQHSWAPFVFTPG